MTCSYERVTFGVLENERAHPTFAAGVCLECAQEG